MAPATLPGAGLVSQAVAPKPPTGAPARALSHLAAGRTQAARVSSAATRAPPRQAPR